MPISKVTPAGSNFTNDLCHKDGGSILTLHDRNSYKQHTGNALGQLTNTPPQCYYAELFPAQQTCDWICPRGSRRFSSRICYTFCARIISRNRHSFQGSPNRSHALQQVRQPFQHMHTTVWDSGLGQRCSLRVQ